MRATEIEAWAHRVMDRVEAGQPNEDARVELKRDWIEGPEMARRLAGHANAARAERVLWLIGVDEKERAVVGVSAKDAATWYPAVTKCFQEVSPGLTDVVVQRGETERAPYLVKNPSFGSQKTPVEFEVPWREGTRVRTARREDLFRVLIPQTSLPACEVRRVSTRAGERDDAPPVESQCVVLLYLVPATMERLYIPFHKCTARLRTGSLDWVSLGSVELEQDRGEPKYGGARQSHSIAASETELVVDGAGGAVLVGAFPLLRKDDSAPHGVAATIDFEGSMELELVLGVARSDIAVRVSARLDPTGTEGTGDAGRWLPAGEGG
jgi:hypothetical protein